MMLAPLRFVKQHKIIDLKPPPNPLDVLASYWASVADGGPALTKHGFEVPCSLGVLANVGQGHGHRALPDGTDWGVLVDLLGFLRRACRPRSFINRSKLAAFSGLRIPIQQALVAEPKLF